MEEFNKKEETIAPSGEAAAETHEQVMSAENFLQTLDDVQKERLDYALNQIGETERSLALADDQEKVVAVLRRIVAQGNVADISALARVQLAPLL